MQGREQVGTEGPDVAVDTVAGPDIVAAPDSCHNKDGRGTEGKDKDIDHGAAVELMAATSLGIVGGDRGGSCLRVAVEEVASSPEGVAGDAPWPQGRQGVRPQVQRMGDASLGIPAEGYTRATQVDLALVTRDVLGSVLTWDDQDCQDAPVVGVPESQGTRGVPSYHDLGSLGGLGMRVALQQGKREGGPTLASWGDQGCERS